MSRNLHVVLFKEFFHKGVGHHKIKRASLQIPGERPVCATAGAERTSGAAVGLQWPPRGVSAARSPARSSGAGFPSSPVWGTRRHTVNTAGNRSYSRRDPLSGTSGRRPTGRRRALPGGAGERSAAVSWSPFVETSTARLLRKIKRDTHKLFLKNHRGRTARRATPPRSPPRGGGLRRRRSARRSL